MISDAIDAAGTGMVQLRKIEAAREIAQTLSTSKNVSYLPSRGENVFLHLGQQ